MLRICLLLLFLNLYTVNGQQKSKYLLQAESLISDDISKAIETAKEAYRQSVQKKDNYNTCLAELFLSNAYRKYGNYIVSTYYDSLAIICSNKQQNILLQQKAANSYIRNFLEQLQIPKSEMLLAGSEALLATPISVETCTWYEIKALCYFNRIRFDSAILTCRAALAVAQQLQDSTASMHLQMLIGKFYTMKLQPDSVKLVYVALRYFERKGDYRHAAQAANIIGFNFETVNSPDKAVYFYDRALAYYNLVNDAHEAAQTRMHLGDAYLAKKESDIAKAYFANGFRYYTTLQYEKGIASTSLRLGKIYSEADQFDSAWYYFKRAEIVNEHLHSPVIKMALNGWEGQLLGRQKKYKAANSLLEKAIDIAIANKDSLMTSVIQKRLADEQTVSIKEIAAPNRLSVAK